MKDLGPDQVEFKDLENVDFVGAFPNYAEAKAAWRGAAQRTVDNAHMRYFIAHLHRLRDEGEEASTTEEIQP